MVINWVCTNDACREKDRPSSLWLKKCEHCGEPMSLEPLKPEPIKIPITVKPDCSHGHEDWHDCETCLAESGRDFYQEEVEKQL